MVKVSLPSFGSGKSRSSRSGSVNEKVASSVSETVLNAPGSIAKGALAVGKYWIYVPAIILVKQHAFAANAVQLFTPRH